MTARRLAPFTAESLQTMKFPPLSYLLPGLHPRRALPAGVAAQAREELARQLDLAIATAEGRFVLGAAKAGLRRGPLSRHGRRQARAFKERLNKLLPTILRLNGPGGRLPSRRNGRAVTKVSPRSRTGLARNVQFEDGKCPRLIIVDTLAQFRNLATGKNDLPRRLLPRSRACRSFASKYNLTIIVVHHDRKGGADDVFDTVSGSLGLPAAADTIAIMKREAGTVTFHIRGRDVRGIREGPPIQQDDLQVDDPGRGVEIRLSDERSRVLAALEKAGVSLTTGEIISLANLVSRTAADKLLLRMEEDGQIERIKRGLYGLPGARDAGNRKMRDRGRQGRGWDQTIERTGDDRDQLSQSPTLPEDC